ncbi:hypothetical protein BGZ65_010403 [Modicella reniformis]|uniref:Uncharacterized protein n=1 Tax=Modicella reniformis TaxID=1440133 RepID=A0A9P6IPH1_9FUNG|nr:hypothetical protein BGZ65_010403 [Modicella reniformis]
MFDIPELRLSFYSDPDDIEFDPIPIQDILLVLDYSHVLTQLDVPGPVLCHNPPFVRLFLDLVATSLPLLQRLTFNQALVDPTKGFQLLEVCFNHPRLVDLQCDFFMGDSQYPVIVPDRIYDPHFAILLKSLQDADKMKAESGEPTGLRLKSLLLPKIESGYPQAFLFPFLRSQLPNLERLGIPRIHNSYDDRELIETISKGCPKLQHIASYDCPEDRDDESSVITIIRSCVRSGLRSFHGHYFDDFNYFLEPRGMIANLVEHHANTLEEVELLDCEGAESYDIASVLMKCRNLKKFRVQASDLGEAVIEFQEVVSEDWVCHDIKVLHLLLGRDTFVPAGKTKEEVVAQAAKTVYGRIGCLSKLEEVSLGSDANCFETRGGGFTEDLTLEHGWLAELAELKELRHFQMVTDFWSSMGQAEVEFMDANWPKLERITIGYNLLDEDVFCQPHWHWLKKKRPHTIMSTIDWGRLSYC